MLKSERWRGRALLHLRKRLTFRVFAPICASSKRHWQREQAAKTEPAPAALRIVSLKNFPIHAGRFDTRDFARAPSMGRCALSHICEFL
ncbi:MAG: hypothetical protein R3E18_13075 [Sphingomonadaceae bacterium]|nr:hypothetical protein [Sphingomonadaceae bacterium]